MYSLTDRLAAFCFDRAVTVFGRALEGELHDKTKDAKNETSRKQKEQTVMNRWLFVGSENKSSGRFADPRARMQKLT